MSLITQYKKERQSADSEDSSLPDKLNGFYARFDRENTSTPVPLPCDNHDPPFLVTEQETGRALTRLDMNKAAGPVKKGRFHDHVISSKTGYTIRIGFTQKFYKEDSNPGPLSAKAECLPLEHGAIYLSRTETFQRARVVILIAMMVTVVLMLVNADGNVEVDSDDDPSDKVRDDKEDIGRIGDDDYCDNVDNDRIYDASNYNDDRRCLN
ncbi:hypothetical protein ElyMa_003512800 [Elysia marginata]|uniref:Uncharacterized protein n=1 Tax=Elysia marginata TaxID=1093978 RepID=A0AAV4EFY0_9GAST|nr:hypothetical protein ElyMa_003512800 [Elysia marginata]